MSLQTNLSSLIVLDSEPALGGATLTSVAISKGGKYYATGDEKGNIYVHRTDSKELKRMYFLPGIVHILQFMQIRSKTMLIAATKRGHLKCWQVNEQNNRVRWQKSFPLCVNAVAVNPRKDRLAVSVGFEVHLYYDPWDMGALSKVLKTWVPTGSATEGVSFYKAPMAIGLHFTPGDDLLLSYLMGYYLVRTIEPYHVVGKAIPHLPSRIAHTTLSPSGQHAVSTNLDKGFDIFNLGTFDFIGTHDYLPALTTCESNHIIQSSFLNEKFLVTGHRDAFICIFELQGEAFGKPMEIAVAGAAGYGIHELTTGVYQRQPFVIALSGKDEDSQYHIIGSRSFKSQQQLKLAPAGLKEPEKTRDCHLCHRMFFMLSLALIFVGVTILSAAFTKVHGFDLRVFM